MMITIDADTLRERIRERLEESESNLDTLCWNCQATLTAADRDTGECTQCGTSIDVNDESVDEDLWND